MAPNGFAIRLPSKPLANAPLRPRRGWIEVGADREAPPPTVSRAGTGDGGSSFGTPVRGRGEAGVNLKPRRRSSVVQLIVEFDPQAVGDSRPLLLVLLGALISSHGRSGLRRSRFRRRASFGAQAPSDPCSPSRPRRRRWPAHPASIIVVIPACPKDSGENRCRARSSAGGATGGR